MEQQLPGGALGLPHFWRESIEHRLEAQLRPRLGLESEFCDPALERLWRAMRHGVLNGGKRARGLLSMAAAQAAGADPLSKAALDVAAALECIHAFSLVHDDMPCMDDDALRRGQPTVHVAYDEPTALLVGDALQTLGMEILAGLQLPPHRVVRIIQVVSRATGAAGMAGGQAIDIHAVGESPSLTALEGMHALKTGALIRAAVLAGALVGPAGEDERSMASLDDYARCVGLAFQVLDDVLDAQADTATLGKTAGKDAAQGKPTFVSLLGMQASRDYAQALYEEAIAAIEGLGHNRRPLEAIALALTQRTY